MNRSGLLKERERAVSQVDTAKSEKKRELKVAMVEQRGQVENKFQEQIDQLETGKADIRSKISSMKSALSEIPPGHPQRRQLEKQIKMLQKRLAQINSQIGMLKFRKNSQKRMMVFQQNMRLKMLEMNFVNQKSMLLKQFAEKIMQFDQMQAAMKAQGKAQQQAAGAGGGKKGKVKPGNKEAGGVAA